MIFAIVLAGTHLVLLLLPLCHPLQHLRSAAFLPHRPSLGARSAQRLHLWRADQPGPVHHQGARPPHHHGDHGLAVSLRGACFEFSAHVLPSFSCRRTSSPPSASTTASPGISLCVSFVFHATSPLTSLADRWMIVMSTQLIGFSIGGIARRFLVHLPTMIWPANLVARSSTRSTSSRTPATVTAGVSRTSASSPSRSWAALAGTSSRITSSSASATSPGSAGSRRTTSSSTRCSDSCRAWACRSSCSTGCRLRIGSPLSTPCEFFLFSCPASMLNCK